MLDDGRLDQGRDERVFGGGVLHRKRAAWHGPAGGDDRAAAARDPFHEGAVEA